MIRPAVRTGCERLLADLPSLAGRTYGVLGHGASITVDCRPLHVALASGAGEHAGVEPPTALFGPEHGYYGVEQDMVASVDERDPLSGVPIVSLYGDDEGSLRPSPEAFAGLDLLIIDLQDIGTRYYTYAATAVWAAEVALAAGLEVWILDRPNPLGGEVVEGNLLGEGFESFVGAFRTPVRHGLTLGELVRLEARRRGWGDGWRVWTLEGWRRSMEWTACGLPWVAPSPNMPTLATALVYPGGCLVEATALSEGRGTTRPFELIGAPGVDASALAADLGARDLPGVRFLPTVFKPQFQKHAGAVCAGVQVMVTDPQTFQSYRTGVEVVDAFHRHLGDAFQWRREAYEFVVDRPAIDLLAGDAALRESLDGGHGLPQAWLESWRGDERAFREECEGILLYD